MMTLPCRTSWFRVQAIRAPLCGESAAWRVLSRRTPTSKCGPLTTLRNRRIARGAVRLYTFWGRLEDEMRATSRLAWVAPAALLCALPLLAHHSFSAEFDANKTVTLRGVVSKVEWINPHIFIYVDVKDGAGKTTTWMKMCGLI